MTPDVKFYECFLENLNHIGFETLLLCDSSPFQYRNFSDRAQIFLRKTFLRNKQVKNKLKSEYSTETYLKTLNEAPNGFDYGLFIRVDLFSKSIIKSTANKVSQIYAYQWDGLKRFKDAYKSIPLFKKFYVFDSDDLNVSDNTELLTNFYFDCYEKIINEAEPKYDVYYLGTYDNRIDEVIQICKELYDLGLKLDINIATDGSKSKNKKLKQFPFIKILNKKISYKENLTQMANSKIILEITNNSIHNGYSFRTFEALGYDKKLITTNNLIKNADFYCEENFHLYENTANLKSFLKKEPVEIDIKIKEKYGFTNWINHVLEIRPDDNE